MRRLIHRDLMRGQLEQRAAILLLTGLLVTLLASIYHGMSSLRA
jgi:hypothetical protein